MQVDFMTDAMRAAHEAVPGVRAVPEAVRERIASITFARNCVIVTRKEAAHDAFTSQWHRRVDHVATKH